MAKVQIFARPNRILFGALRFLDALQVLSHRVDRTVHVQQFAVQILFRSVVRLATIRKYQSFNRELVSKTSFSLLFFLFFKTKKQKIMQTFQNGRSLPNSALIAIVELFFSVD